VQMHSAVASLVADASLALLATPGSAQTGSTAEASVSRNLRQPRMHRLPRRRCRVRPARRCICKPSEGRYGGRIE
jgi:hypothetical protein